MAIKARYDGREDRMLLVFEAGGDSRRALWVTRRQWLNLHSVLGSPATQEEAAAPGAKAPAERGQPLPDTITTGAERLDNIRFAHKGDSVHLTFVAGEQPIGIVLQGDALAQMQQLVHQQADRAGWDPDAALVRLQAGAAANQVMRKAAG